MAGRGMTARKGGHFVAIAATGHGTPAPAASARGVIEEQAASRVGTDAKTRVRALGDNFSGRTRDSGEEPIQAALASDEFQSPSTILEEEFVVPFGDAQDIVDGFDPAASNGFLVQQRAKALLKGGMQTPGFGEERVGGLRIVLWES